MEEVARPFRVCLTGAESTGKSELARRLGRHFGAPVVPEFSRQYAERVARGLSWADVEPIARGQIDAEERLAAAASGLVILDTDLLSTVVYSRHHYGSCPEWVVRAARDRRSGLYLLLDIDVPWISDPVRDSGDRRAELQDAFRSALAEFGAKYEVVSGPWDERIRRAVEVISACDARVFPLRRDRK